VLSALKALSNFLNAFVCSMIHIQTGSEKVPAAHQILPMAWYPKNEDRVAKLRMTGTPAYALGHHHVQ
jgi:hypothetical protein